MTYDLHPEARALIESRPTAHLVTMRPNGKPHVSFIWLDVTDDGRLQFGTPNWRVKGRNVAHDPNVIFSIQDTKYHPDNGLLQHLLIDGVASIDDHPEHGNEFMEQLWQKYTGKTGFPMNAIETHLLITVDITRVSGVGPWHTGNRTPYGTPA